MSRLQISLGCRCDVAWQLRRAFGETAAYPFDWLVTPLSGVVGLLRNRFADLVNQKYLEVVRYNAGWTVMNTRYQVFLHHEFKRSPGGMIAEDWRNDVENVSEKYRFISQRFFDALKKEKNIVFYRRGGEFDMPGEMDLPTSAKTVLELYEVLSFHSRSNPTLVMLNCAETPTSKGIIKESVAAPSVEDTPERADYWKGSAAQYDTMFARLGVLAGAR